MKMLSFFVSRCILHRVRLDMNKENLQEVKQKTEGANVPSPDQYDKRADREFLRGAILGFLVAGVVFMSFWLFRYGTFGRKGNDAQVIASSKTERKLNQVANIIDNAYLNDLDAEKLESYLFKGIAAGLDDPYARYYTKDELEEMSQSQEGEYYGIGIIFTKEEEEEYPKVVSVFEGSPAQREGMQADDLLLEVEGTDLKSLDTGEIADLVASAGDEVHLKIRRGKEDMEILVKLDRIETAPVESRMIDETIGYVKVTEFDAATVKQFETALTDLQDEGMTSLIVDLRDNPGGMVNTVTDMLDCLLPECLIVSTETKNGTGKEIYSDKEQLYDGPVAVLVNGDSASASEIFAGAIQDYDRGPIVGEQTFGKGIIQRTYGLMDGSAFKLTTEKYITPGGQDIHGKGITPDIEVSGEKEQLEQAVKALSHGE